jgi:hypothetical protein
MNLSPLVMHVLGWGLVGSLMLTAFVAVQYTPRVGEWIRRHATGTPKQRQQVALRLLLMNVGLQLLVFLLTDIHLAARMASVPTFNQLWRTAFEVAVIMQLWDFLIIDLLILLVLKPSFLRIPDTPYYKQVRPHVRGLLKGLLLGLMTSLVASGLVWLVI